MFSKKFEKTDNVKEEVTNTKKNEDFLIAFRSYHFIMCVYLVISIMKTDKYYVLLQYHLLYQFLCDINQHFNCIL